MCGRFALKETPKQLAEYFHLAGNLSFTPAFNIAPSLPICCITADMDGVRHLRMMRWGLIPAWAKDASIGNKLANARGETVAEKPSFRSAFKSRRCIIPASGFYEWKAEGSYKQPWYVSLKTGNPMAFAGLWESWHSKDDEVIVSCCIITTDANTLMQSIHDRMPVILNPDQWVSWLSPKERNPNNLIPLLCPHDSASMQAWQVTRELNRVGLRNDAGLLDPLPENA